MCVCGFKGIRVSVLVRKTKYFVLMTNPKCYLEQNSSACSIHAIQILILYSNPKNHGSHSKKTCLVHEI